MKTRRNLLIAGAGLAVCLIAARLALTAAEDRHTRSYNVDQWVTTPEYKTDAGQAIDAYERLMERYADLAEAQLMDCQVIAEKMDSFDAKMGELLTRLARIEKALGPQKSKRFRGLSPGNSRGISQGIDPNGNTPSKPAKKSGLR